MRIQEAAHVSSDEDEEMSSSDEEEEQESDNDLLVSGDEDSDEGPEDVDFSRSKETALQQVRDSLQQIRRGKDDQKKRRQEKDDMYKNQKKQKLDSMRLPRSVVESLAAQPIRAKATTSEQAETPKVAEKPASSDEAEEEEESNEGSGAEDGNFIKLKADAGVKAVHTKEQLQIRLTSAQAAEEFRQKQLYGNKVNRITAKAQLGRIAKRQVRNR